MPEDSSTRRPLRIGLFTDTYDPQINGIITSINSLRDALRRRGHEVYVFAPRAGHSTVDEPSVFRQRSVRYAFQPEYQVASPLSRSALRQAREWKLDIVHAHSEMSMGVVASRIAKRLNLPHVFTFHVMLEDFRQYFLWGLFPLGMARDYLAALYEDPDFIIAPSEKVQVYLRHTLGIDKDIEVIPTGLDLGLFDASAFSKEDRARWRAGNGLGVDDVVMVSVGRISEEKNLDVALRSMPELLKRHPRLRYLIVGDGPSRPGLVALARQLGIEREVVFTGFVPWEKIPGVYRSSDLLVFLSCSESQGLVTIEAMASGLPVIEKSDGARPSLAEPGGNSMAFDDEEGFREAVERLLSDKTLMKDCSRRSVEISSRFSLAEFGERVEGLYYRALESHRERDPYGAWQFIARYASNRLDRFL